MSYHVLVFSLGRPVESHPFSWAVSPACHAHRVLDREADEAIVVPNSGGLQAPPSIPSEPGAAHARAELGPMEQLNQVPLIFWINEEHPDTIPDRVAQLSARVADACRSDRILFDDDALAHADDFSKRTMTDHTREAVTEARDREQAAAILDHAAEHDWHPECSVQTAYEQYLFTDALNAIEELPDRGVSVPHEHVAAVPRLRRRATEFDSK